MSYNPQNPNGQAAMANSAPVVVASNQSNIPVIAAPDTSSLYSGTTVLTPGFATISTSSSGSTIISGASTGKKIRVISYVIVANAAVNVKFQSSTGSTDVTGLFYLSANGGISGAYAPTGHFQTTTNSDNLIISLSSAVAVGGHITYVLV